jgi:hypothetical protein
MDEVLQENPAFDSEEIYHTKSLDDHETVMDYLNSAVPTETTHNLMRVSEANHWNKNMVKGIFELNFLFCLLRILRGSMRN